MRQPTVQNKYNLTVAKLKELKCNRNKITTEHFWRNNVINAWCISANTCKTRADDEFGTYNEYWVGVYDEDAKSYAGKIRVTFSAYGGMCHYNFRNFFDAKEIENDLDLRIQEMFIEKMNQLLDEGVFYFGD